MQGFYNGYRDIISIADNLEIEIRHEILYFIIFYYLIGNNDGHLKNLSLLYEPNGNISLAPFYDLVCTEIYENIDNEMAIAFGSHYTKDDICYDDILILAGDLQMDYTDIERRLEELISILPSTINKTRNECDDRQIVEKISKKIIENIVIAKDKLLYHS